MKRYNFCFSLSALFFSVGVFCGSDEAYSLTLFDRKDVVKYLLVKQLDVQHKCKGVLAHTLNPLLASLKKSRIRLGSELRTMNIKKFAYYRTEENSPVYGHWFAFSDVPSPYRWIYNDGRALGRSGDWLADTWGGSRGHWDVDDKQMSLTNAEKQIELVEKLKKKMVDTIVEACRDERSNYIFQWMGASAHKSA